jgi:probable blue pigment (indigoidine) exporter
MEAKFRWVLVTAIAPVAWGTTYFVTHRFLPADQPLYGAVIRALPAGLLLLLLRRKLPHGSWWWRSLVLGSLNMGAFFALVYLAAQLLPTSIASTVMATSPVAMMLLAWLALSERPRIPHLAGAVIGIAGVLLMLVAGPVAVAPVGMLASVAAMAMSSLGYVLTKKWSADVDVFSLTSWQLIAGAVVLLPVAVAVEGPPPVLAGPALLAFGYVTVIATAAAFAAWFTGLRHLSAATVGLIGLLNPITGVLLGTVLAGETLTARQGFGVALVFVGILLGQPVTTRLATLLRSGRTSGSGPTPGSRWLRHRSGETEGVPRAVAEDLPGREPVAGQRWTGSGVQSGAECRSEVAPNLGGR